MNMQKFSEKHSWMPLNFDLLRNPYGKIFHALLADINIRVAV